MYFSSWQALWEMAGHGAFVWSAYVLSWLIIIALVVHPLNKQRQVLRAIKLRQKNEEARGGHAS